MNPTVLLRPLEPADAPALHALLTHPEVAVDLVEYDPSQPSPLFRSMLERVTPPSGFWVGACIEGVLVGAGSLRVSPALRRRHTGHAQVAVAPERRRRGVGRTLLATLLDAASRDYSLHRLELSIPDGATGGLQVAKQLGFVEEARRRQPIVRNGKRTDVLLMTWLRPGMVAAPSALPLPPRLGDHLAVTLRTAGPDDAEAIAAMQGTESVRRGTMQLPFTQTGFWRQRLETNDPAQHHLRVAEHAGRVVGLSGLHGEGLIRGSHTWGFGMSVHPEVQGRGVGGALVRDVLSLADSWLGAGRVELEVYADNERAIALYRRHGFEVEGTKRCDTWRDAGYVDTLVMGRLASRV